MPFATTPVMAKGGEALDPVLTDKTLRQRVRRVRGDIAKTRPPEQVVQTLVRLSNLG